MSKRIKVITLLVALTVSSITVFAQKKTTGNAKADTLVNFKVTAAPEWTDMFYRNNGWFGADGIFEMTLSGKESIGAGTKDSVLMYFSDTMTGNVVGNEVEDFKMINNSFAWITGLKPSAKTVTIFYKQDRSCKTVTNGRRSLTQRCVSF